MRVLAYGGGVNSTAILALIKLGKIKMPDRIVFCDTGAEKPDTICYVRYISKEFPQIEIHKNKKYNGLIDYCEKHKVIPTRQFRWCTDKFKTQVINKAVGTKDFTRILGIDYGEQRRVKDYACEYPLIELKIDRNGCYRYIQEAGFITPVKSGCFICPFMSKKEIRDLRIKEPTQFYILAGLELEAHKRNPNLYFKIDGKLVTEYTTDDTQEELDGFENYQHCLCKFD